MVYYQQEYRQPIIYVTIIYLIVNFQIDIILFQIRILKLYPTLYTSPNIFKKIVLDPQTSINYVIVNLLCYHLCQI
jgi:hypothetical protein